MFELQSAGPIDRPVLIIPGLNNSGPDHWQSRWERERSDCRRVELGHWSVPLASAWVDALHQAIVDAGAPVLLAAHSLGCHAVAHWAAFHAADPSLASRISGALLVAPPWLDETDGASPLAAFAGFERQTLPFPAILVASRDDPYASLAQSRQMARDWGTRFADAGRVGHINSQSGIGSWPFGQFLLELLLRDRRRQQGLRSDGAMLAA